jgi:hypothetical protein
MRLAMTTIEPAVLPLYSSAQTLAPRPVPTVEEATTAPEEDEAAGTDAADGADADTNADAEGGADAPGTGEAGATDSGDKLAEDTPGRAEELASAAEEAGGEAAGGGESTPAGTTGTSVYCYTIDIEAKGWLKQLLAFLESTRGITAMEIVSYSYTEPEAEIPGSGGLSLTKPTGNSPASTVPEEPEGGTIVMQIKLYVFVGGDMTAGSAAGD